jgi:hypothetical protein
LTLALGLGLALRLSSARGVRSGNNATWESCRDPSCTGSCAATHQVPKENAAVVCAGGKHTALGVAPIDAVDARSVAFEFEEGLAWLPHVEDTDDRGVLAESGEKMGVVGRGGDAEEGRGKGKGGEGVGARGASGRG